MSIRFGKRTILGIVALAIAVLGLTSANPVLCSKLEAAGPGPYVFHANGDHADLWIAQPPVDPDK